MRNSVIAVGTRVREIRKKMGFSMKQLAQKVGVNLLTIHRIETGKVSPSVALLSEISYHLNYPLSSFLAEERPVILIKGNEQPIIEGNKLRLKILAHKVFDGGFIKPTARLRAVARRLLLSAPHHSRSVNRSLRSLGGRE